MRAPGARSRGASSCPRPYPRLRRRPEPERARVPVPGRGFPGAPGPPAGRPARLQRQATRHPGPQVPLGRGAWPPPRPAGADRRAGHRDPLLSQPICTPDPLLEASLLVLPDGAPLLGHF